MLVAMLRKSINGKGAYMADCRHCKEKKATRARGLCSRCYHTPGVRDLYPSTSKFARRSMIPLAEIKPCAVPTIYPPGTAEKVAVLEERALRGVRLWHPEDAAA